MTPKERLLAVFDRIEPDVVPFAPDLTYYFDAAVIDGKIRVGSDPIEREKALVNFHIERRCIPYYLYGNGVFDFVYDGVEVLTRREGDRSVTEYRVNGRTICDVREYHRVSYSWAPVKYAVETRADLEVLLEFVRRTRCVPNVRRWVEANDRLGELGVVTCMAQRSPLPAMIVDWSGVEHSIFLMADEPELFAEVLEAIDRANDAAFDVIGGSPVRLVHFADNLTGLTFAGLWDRYLAEYYHRRVDQLHAAGKVCASHLDGTLLGMLGRMARTGLDAIESITPAPVGDLTLAEVERDLAGFDTILWGGIPGAMFCRPFGWEHVQRQVDELLNLHRRGRRIIVASADQVPPDADITLVQRVGAYLGS